MKRSCDYRKVIIEIIGQQLALEKYALEQFKKYGRLDEVTAADSMFLVELVMMLEEHFDIRFAPEHLDVELLCNLDWLTAFVAESVVVE